MAGETVIGVFSRDELSPVLLRVHRRRLGAQVRVLDAARGAVEPQLARAGFPLVATPEIQALGAQAAVILVGAPGRQDEVAQLLTDLGAKAVSIHRPIPVPVFGAANPVSHSASPAPDPTLLHPDQASGAGDMTNS